MLSKLPTKAVLITLSCAIALIVVGAATALASRASATSSAPAARPVAAIVAPQAPALASTGPHARKAGAAPSAPEAALAPAQPVTARLSSIGEPETLAVERREFIASGMHHVEATPEPPMAASSARPAAAAAIASPEPSTTPEPSETPETEHPAEVEFKGSVESISGDTIVVGGQIVITNDQTQFPDGMPLVGAWVEVEGFAQANGSVLAKEIKIEHPQGDDDVAEVEFKAPIESMPSGTYEGEWLIGGHTVTVTDTNVVNDSRVTLPVVVGDIAEVKAVQKAGGPLVALRIQIEDREEFENEAEFKGTISVLSGSAPTFTMTINGITVVTDADTQIDGALADGKLVEVNGSAQPDGSVLARTIHVEDPQAPPDELEFRSTIATLPASGFVGTWTFGNGESVTVDASTLIDESRGPAVAGATVEVKAIKQGDAWLAIRIQVEND